MAKKLAFDPVLFAVVAVLLAVGLVMVFSASAAVAMERTDGPNPFLIRQGVAALIGLFAMWVAMHVDYRVLRKPAVVYGALALTVGLLILVLFQPQINGTRRWLLVGGFSFQPSELAKLAMVVFGAYQAERQLERSHRWELVVPCCGVAALLAGLVILEPDMGTAALVAFAALLMLFLAGAPISFFAASAAALAPVAWLLIRLEPYRWRRITAFLEPERYALDAGFQADQSLIAVGSGGVLGLGLGNSAQKLHYLPHPESDFIYSIIAEELGLLGAAAVLALFGLFLWRGVRAGLGVRDHFGRYLAWGLSGWIALQAVLHISVSLSLMPTTGVPLPFLSAGGTALIVTMTACGILLNISQHG